VTSQDSTKLAICMPRPRRRRNCWWTLKDSGTVFAGVFGHRYSMLEAPHRTARPGPPAGMMLGKRSSMPPPTPGSIRHFTPSYLTPASLRRVNGQVTSLMTRLERGVAADGARGSQVTGVACQGRRRERSCAIVADVADEGQIKNHRREVRAHRRPVDDVDDGRQLGSDKPRMSLSSNSAGW